MDPSQTHVVGQTGKGTLCSYGKPAALRLAEDRKDITCDYCRRGLSEIMSEGDPRRGMPW
jgi:hypothetical protein